MRTRTIDKCETEVVMLRQQVLSAETRANKRSMSLLKENDKLYAENSKLLHTNADLRDEVQELRNLLYVLSRYPNELDNIRSKMFGINGVDNSEFLLPSTVK